MAELKNVNISLRIDDLSNWVTANPILKRGEMAIVIDEKRNQKIKIGDGSKTFTQLDYLFQNELSTLHLLVKDVDAQSISQGINAKSTPYGLAAGAFISANANFSQAFGFNSETSAGHDYSFVWNGDDGRAIGDFYQSHGKGTFSVNPKEGLSGFYIGERSLDEIISENDVEITIKHQDQDPEQVKQLSILEVSGEDYDKLVIDEEILSDAIYVVNRDYVETYGERIVNVADPIDLSDATNKKYVDSKFSQVEVPTKVSQLQNDVGYLSAHQSLSDYYTKEDVDEISSNLANKSIVRLSIPESRVQQDLSVLNIVKVSKTKYQQMESLGAVLSDHLYIVEADDDEIIFGGNSFTC